MFTEFAPVTREQWEAQASKDSPRFAEMLYGPGVEMGAAQPWRPAAWEILEEIPGGLFALPEAPAIEQLAAARIGGATAFLVPVDTQYFEEIAKFRALRRIFDQPIRIVAVTGRVHQTIYDPHVNLLRATTCAMSAILGGCDALVVRRFDEARGGDAGDLARQLAINTQLLLREEAGFDLAVDPAAGSWYLEALTQAFCEGSTLHAPQRRELIGITKFADPNETAGVPISEGRAATPYEKLRAAAERATERPRVRLVLGQDAKMSRARAAFARNVFHSGGFVIAEPAQFLVLCGADAEYPQMIEANAGLPQIVAGPETPGAFDFVNMKSDLVAKLQAWQRHLGISA